MDGEKHERPHRSDDPERLPYQALNVRSHVGLECEVSKTISRGYTSMDADMNSVKQAMGLRLFLIRVHPGVSAAKNRAPKSQTQRASPARSATLCLRIKSRG